MAMQFLDTLDDKQSHVASVIIEKAKKAGVDPRLALALAFRENSLRHGDFQRDDKGEMKFKPAMGSAGEVGLMQVKPNTAKQYGFDPKDLNDLEKNIDIGLKILKSNIDRFGDPVLAVSAYNTGADHPFYTDPDKNPLPDRTKKYIKDIEGYGGFTSFTDKMPAAQPADEDRGLPMMSVVEPTAPAETSLKEEFEKRIPAAIGAGLGATTGTAIAAGKKAKSATDLLKQFMESQIAAKQIPITGVNVPAQGMVGAAPSMGGLPPPTGPLANTPAGGRMTQNWIKAQDTAGRYADVGQQARDMGEAHRMKQAAMAAEDKIRQIAPEMAQVPERSGLFLPQQTGTGPRGARTVPINEPVSYSLLDDAIEKLGQIAKGGLRFVSSAPVSGALGGYGAVSSGEEAFKRQKAGDRLGTAYAGLGTLQALAAIPNPYTQGIGLASGIASPLGLAILDRMRKIKAEPTIEPSAAEMERAQRPAVMYPNP